MEPGSVNSSLRSGLATLAGRPNVGKSTLLNALLGTKVAIVSPRPQTTRTRVLGVQTSASAQIVWVDTPGLLRVRGRGRLLQRRMVDAARTALGEADVIVAVVDATDPTDDPTLDIVAASTRPWVIVVNKIDRIGRPRLLELVARVGARFPGLDVVPVSARTGENLGELESTVVRLLPEGPFLFPEDEITDQAGRTLVAEFVREQAFLQLGDELPYGTAVLVESWTERPEKDLAVVTASILVERESHRRMVVGKGGARIRQIGIAARQELEALLERRLYLELHVRVRKDWSRDPRILDELGIR